MADLIAIGYPDETTAEAADDEARRLARDLIIQSEALAAIERDKDGARATLGMFWDGCCWAAPCCKSGKRSPGRRRTPLLVYTVYGNPTATIGKGKQT